MLSDERRQELVARLEGLGDSSESEAAEPTESTQEAGANEGDDRGEAEPVAAAESEPDDESNSADSGRQSAAQRRISDLVRQRNEATDQFRQLQERHAAMEQRMQGLESSYSAPQRQQSEPEYEQQEAYYDSYGNPVDPSQINPGLSTLRQEFDSYREAQAVETARTELESELADAVGQYPNVDGQWLRSQLIDAVRLNGNANIAEVAEYYAAFVEDLQQGAVSQYQQTAPERTPAPAPPRLGGRGTASHNGSQQGDKPFTRQDARARARALIAGH